MSRYRVYRKDGTTFYVDDYKDEYVGDMHAPHWYSYYIHKRDGDEIAYRTHSWSGRITGSGREAKVFNPNYFSNHFDYYCYETDERARRMAE